MKCNHFTHMCCEFLELLFMCLSLLICLSIIIITTTTVELVSGCVQCLSGKMHRTGRTKHNQKPLTMCQCFFSPLSVPLIPLLLVNIQVLSILKLRELGLSAGSVAEDVITA